VYYFADIVDYVGSLY